MLPVNPFTSTTVIVSVLLLPWTTVTLAVKGASVKPGAGFTVTELVPEALL